MIELFAALFDWLKDRPALCLLAIIAIAAGVIALDLALSPTDRGGAA